jgi:hypothetical protein
MGPGGIRVQYESITAPQNESANKVLHTPNIHITSVFSAPRLTTSVFSAPRLTTYQTVLSAPQLTINHNVGIFSSAANYQYQSQLNSGIFSSAATLLKSKVNRTGDAVHCFFHQLFLFCYLRFKCCNQSSIRRVMHVERTGTAP